MTFHGAVARTTPVDPRRAALFLANFAAANWFLVALGLAGLAVTTGQSRGAVTAWLAADLAALFLWRPVWAHHLVILVAPLAVLGAAAVEKVSRTAERAHGTPDTAAPPPAARKPASLLAAGTLIAGWLVALTGTIADAVPATSGSLRAAAAEIAQAVPAGGWVITDDPIVPFLAGRDVPPGLSDTSEMRMQAGWLTTAALAAAAGDPRARGVVLWRGTFRRMVPEFVEQAAAQFPRQWTWGDGRMILAR